MGNTLPVVLYVVIMAAVYLVMYRPIMVWAEEDLDGVDDLDRMAAQIILLLIALLWPLFAAVLIVKAVSKLVEEAI